MQACFVCKNSSWRLLPEPNARQSLSSDYRILATPLQKLYCETCGAVRRAEVTPVDFQEDYTLYAHAPGSAPPEATRQSHYAQWLAENLPPVGSLLEVGCGNGSLLQALKRIWPDCRVEGLEPAPGAVLAARQAGLQVKQGYLQLSKGERPYDLAISVNVMEHVDNPINFLSTLGHKGSMVAVVCPDGDAPNSELLFCDHLHSWASAHVRTLFSRAGLRVVKQAYSPAILGNFVLTVGVQGEHEIPVPYVDRWLGTDSYLAQWRKLDDELLERIGPDRTVAYGAGEAAALLAAYTPRAWERVDSCMVDHVDKTSFAGKPVIKFSEKTKYDTVLLAVRPQSQATVAQRVCAQRVIRYDDLIAQ